MLIKSLKLDDPIYYLPLSVRLCNIIEMGGWKTVGDVVNATWEELMRRKGMGYLSMQELNETLMEHGFIDAPKTPHKMHPRQLRFPSMMKKNTNPGGVLYVR